MAWLCLLEADILMEEFGSEHLYLSQEEIGGQSTAIRMNVMS